MPWREVSVMKQRREFIELFRPEGVNRQELCRRFGISRTVAYKWLARFSVGDGDLADRSRRPHLSPGRSTAAIEAAVLAVRDAHPVWGRARSHAACNARGTMFLLPRRCMRSCGGVGASCRQPGRQDSLTDGSRRRRRTCSGKWTSKVTCHLPTVRPATL